MNNHKVIDESEMQKHTDNLLDMEIQAMDNLWQDDVGDAIGRTLFDQPGSQDHTITVVLPDDQMARVPAHALVRIRGRPPEQGGDGRQYLGVVSHGPFAEPDGLRSDSAIVVTVAVQGGLFLPRYHGRIQVRLIGEELPNGGVVPARFRPLPNSPVYLLSQAETAEKLKVNGDVRLGLAVGYDELAVCLPTTRKDVLPRHMAVLGSTGGGKTVSTSGLIGGLSQQSVAVVVFDTEGEYTHLMQPTEDATMQVALTSRGLEPRSLEDVGVYHLVGRESSHPDYRDRQEFGLEIIGLNDAQQERFLRAYELSKHILATLKIYPANRKEEQEALERDELETGCPHLTLQMMYDIVWACAELAADLEIHPFTSVVLEENRTVVLDVLHNHARSLPGNTWSWRKVQGALGRLVRMRIFDTGDGLLPDYERMTEPRRVTVVDLSGTDSQPLNNLVISQLLLGLWQQQEANYQASTQGDGIRKVMIVIEEAHEFLSAARIKQMEVLFDQVVRIARRGRKRWLGLVFVSQSPEDLPDEVLGLVNNFILHKITNANVISRLKRSVGGVEGSLWEQLPDLEPGMALVKAGHLARPMLVAMDPTPYKLLMVD